MNQLTEEAHDYNKTNGFNTEGKLLQQKQGNNI